MNSAFPNIRHSLCGLLPLSLLLSAAGAQAASGGGGTHSGQPVPPKITYTITGQGITGTGSHQYFYQDLSFTIFGFENVSPQVVASGVDDIYGFSNSTFEEAGGIVTPASLPPGYTFSGNHDFLVHTGLPSRAIFATDPKSGFNLVTDILASDSSVKLENQPFKLLNKNGGVIAIATPQPVPEAATGWSFGLLLALGGVGLWAARRKTSAAKS